MKEFKPTDLLEWTKDKAYPEGVYKKILYRDPESKTYTRLLKFESGAKGDSPVVHGFEEVVYILSGRLVNIDTGETYAQGAYAYFPKGTKHGPFSAPVGCTTIEFRHFKT